VEVLVRSSRETHQREKYVGVESGLQSGVELCVSKRESRTVSVQ
jgi:hypothetical protein